MKKSTFDRTATMLLVLCAVVVTALFVRRELVSTRAVETRELKRIDGWEQLAATGQFIGPPDAPLKIVEFADYQCPFCRDLHDTLRILREEYADSLLLIYRHFPLRQVHPHAYTAAMASECAADQGRFGAYHDVLFEQQPSIGTKPWDQFAMLAGVPDLGEFANCLREERFSNRILDDLEAARIVPVRQTPTLIINGWLIEGVRTRAELEAYIGRGRPVDQAGDHGSRSREAT